MTLPPAPARRRRATAVAAAAALLALTMGAASPAAADTEARVRMTPELEARIQQMVTDFQTGNAVVGVSVAVVTPDDAGSPVVTTFAAGTTEYQGSTPVDARTQFELGSETKAFTADVLAYLVASGQLSLDDSLQHFAPPGYTVPKWPDRVTGPYEITLRDLVTHQAALPDVPQNFEWGCPQPTPPPTTPASCENWRPGYTQQLLWEGIRDLDRLEWQPGTRWQYSNWGFALLGEVVSTVLHPVLDPTLPPDYQRAVDETFLDALGMDSTVLETPGTTPAPPYQIGGTTPTWTWSNWNAFSGAGGLLSNADDMGKWVAAHLGYVDANAPLGVRSMADTLQQIGTITEQCPKSGPCVSPSDLQSGMAWQLYREGWNDIGVPHAFKNGGTHGSSSDTVLAPSAGVGVTDMFNQYRPDDSNLQLAEPILALLIPVRHEPRLPETGSSVDDLALPVGGAVALIATGLALAVGRRPASRRGR